MKIITCCILTSMLFLLSCGYSCDICGIYYKERDDGTVSDDIAARLDANGKFFFTKQGTFLEQATGKWEIREDKLYITVNVTANGTIAFDGSGNDKILIEDFGKNGAPYITYQGRKMIKKISGTDLSANVTNNHQCFSTRLNEYKSSNPKLDGQYEPMYYAASEHSMKDFIKRLNEYKSSNPKLGGQYEPMYYAASEHSMEDFIKRLNEYKSSNPKLGGQYEPMYYAASERSMEDFIKRLSEYKSSNPKLGGQYEPMHYATSEHSMEDFIKRLNEYKSSNPELGGQYEPMYYAQSIHEICK